MIVIPCRGTDGVNVEMPRAWYMTPDGWKCLVIEYATIEFAPDCWRAHLEAIYELAEGRTMAALERIRKGET
ncbi:MAG: hypothetical protein MUP14_03895 [Dehalococcoidia bacterium]|nr:hypothetical protein [Dehalococcoidia bacterium]